MISIICIFLFLLFKYINDASRSLEIDKMQFLALLETGSYIFFLYRLQFQLNCKMKRIRHSVEFL